MGVGSSRNDRMFVVDRKARHTLERLDTSFNRTASQLKTILNEEIQLIKKIDPKDTRALSKALDTLIILRERSVMYRARIRKMIPLTDAHRLVLKDLRRYLRRIRYHTSKIGRLLGKSNKKFNAYIEKLPQDIVPIRTRKYRKRFTKPITKAGLVNRVNNLPKTEGNAPYVEVVANVEPQNKQALMEMSQVVDDLEERNKNVARPSRIQNNIASRNNTAVKIAQVKSKEAINREEIRSEERVERNKLRLEREKLASEQRSKNANRRSQSEIERQKLRKESREMQIVRNREAENRKFQSEKARREMLVADRERRNARDREAANRRLELQKLRATKEKEITNRRLQEAKERRLDNQRKISESREERLRGKEMRSVSQRGSFASQRGSFASQRGSFPMSQRGSFASQRGSFPMSQGGQTPSQQFIIGSSIAPSHPNGVESIEALKLKQKSANLQSKRDMELEKLKSKREFELESKRLKASQESQKSSEKSTLAQLKSSEKSTLAQLKSSEKSTLAQLKSKKSTRLAELKSAKNGTLAQLKTEKEKQRLKSKESKQLSKNRTKVQLKKIGKEERSEKRAQAEKTAERKGQQSLEKKKFQEVVRKEKVKEGKNRRDENRAVQEKKNKKAKEKQEARNKKREANKQETKEFKENVAKLLGAFTRFRKNNNVNNSLKVQMSAIAALVDDRQVLDYVFGKRITEPSIMKTSEKLYTTVAKMYMQSSAFEDEQVEKLIPLLNTMSLEELETLRSYFNVKLFALSNEPTYVKNVKELYISKSRVQKYISEVLPTNSEIYRWYQKYSAKPNVNTLWGPPRDRYQTIRENYKVMFDRMLNGVKEYEAKYDNISTGRIKTTPYIKKIFETNTNKEINREYDKIERYILRQEMSKIQDRLACGPLTVQFVKYFNTNNNPNATIPENQNKRIKVESFKRMKDFINNASIDTLHDIRQEWGTQVSKRENTYMKELSKNERCVMRTFLKQTFPDTSQAYTMYLNSNNNGTKYYSIRMKESFNSLDTWFKNVDLKTIISIPADIKVWLYNGKAVKNLKLGSFAVSVLKNIIAKHVKTRIGKEDTLEWVIATLKATNDNFNLDYTNLPKNTNKSSTDELKKELNDLQQMYDKSKSTAEMQGYESRIDIIKHELWWRQMTNFSKWSQMIKNFKTSIKTIYDTKEDMPEKLADVFRRFRKQYQSFEKAPFMLYRQKVGYALGLLKNDMNILNNPPPYDPKNPQYNRKPEEKKNVQSHVKLSLPKALSIPRVSAPKLTLPKTAIQLTVLKTVVQLKTPTRTLKSVPIPRGAVTLSVGKKKLSIPKHVGTSVQLTPGKRHVLQFYAPKPPTLRHTRPELKNINNLVKKKAIFEIEKQRKAAEKQRIAEEEAEKQRIAEEAEKQRIAAETQRIAAEKRKANAEAAKKAAEKQREAAEEEAEKQREAAKKAAEEALTKLKGEVTMDNLRALHTALANKDLNQETKKHITNEVTELLRSKFTEIMNKNSDHAEHLKTLSLFNNEQLLKNYGVLITYNSSVAKHMGGLKVEFNNGDESKKQNIIISLNGTRFKKNFEKMKAEANAAIETKRTGINMIVKNIMVSTLRSKGYNRQNGFIEFYEQAKTEKERRFLELYHEAHKALKNKCPISKMMRPPNCQRILNHIDSIFDMTALKNKKISDVRIIKDGEIACLEQTIKDINSLKIGGHYAPSCNEIMDKIHGENLVKDKEVILGAIDIVKNSRKFNELTEKIRQVTQEEFMNLLFTPVPEGQIQKVRSLTRQHAEALFDFIDTNIRNGIASRNYMVSKSEMDQFKNGDKRDEKLKLLEKLTLNKLIKSIEKKNVGIDYASPEKIQKLKQNALNVIPNDFKPSQKTYFKGLIEGGETLQQFRNILSQMKKTKPVPA